MTEAEPEPYYVIIYEGGTRGVGRRTWPELLAFIKRNQSNYKISYVIQVP